jgi:hypothetical protein
MLAVTLPGAALGRTITIEVQRADGAPQPTDAPKNAQGQETRAQETAGLQILLPGGEVLERVAVVPGQVVVELPAAPVRLQVVGEHYWSPEQVVRPPAAEEPATAGQNTAKPETAEPTAERITERIMMELWPAVVLTGELVPPPGEPSPRELAVRFLGGRDGGPPSGALAGCPVTEGRFRCAVPSGRLDLDLRARGYLTHRFWDRALPPFVEVPLGKLTLQHGASIVGWVEAPARDFDFARCQVRVYPRPLSSTALSPRAVEALGLPQVRPNGKGFFELTPLPPGTYLVTVEHPSYALAQVAPVEVLEGAETEIRGIGLAPPATLELAITPPHHPYRTPWQVELHQKSQVPGASNLAGQGSTDEGGGWTAGGLNPGEHFLYIVDERGSRWWYEELVVAPGHQRHEVQLPIERVEVTVRLGDEPLPATLYFGGRFGAPRIVGEADEEGKAYLFLPKQEEWLVDVDSRDRGVTTRVYPVKPHKSPGDPWAMAEIELPDTRIEGRVMDEQGKPVPGVEVHAVGDKPGARSTHADDPRAEFAFAGLPEGTWHLHGTLRRDGESWSSDAVVVTVAEGAPVGPVQLVVRQERALPGVVLDPAGNGAPAAEVIGRMEPGPGLSNFRLPSAKTAVDGTFTLHVPAAARGLQLSVFAPGFAASQLRVDAAGTEILPLTVTPEGGTVVIRYAGGEGVSPLSRRARTVLFHRHMLPSGGFLADWAEVYGVRQEDPSRFVIPHLAPGPYTACFDVGSLSGLPPAGDPRCVSGELSAYGELELRLSLPDR